MFSELDYRWTELCSGVDKRTTVVLHLHKRRNSLFLVEELRSHQSCTQSTVVPTLKTSFTLSQTL